MKKHYLRSGGILLFFILVALLFAGFYIDYRFYHPATEPVFASCFKVWAHRGYHKEHAQNSIEACKTAFSLGAKGVEIDIFYDEGLQTFIVSHDKPYNLKKGKLLTLDNLLGKVTPNGYFWLDFKELSRVKNIEAVARQLHMVLKRHDLVERAFVESQNGYLLSKFSKHGLFTCLWLSFNKENTPLVKYVIKEAIRRVIIATGRFNAISLPYTYYTESIKAQYSQFPLHLFTVNDSDIIDDFINDPKVNIILTDENFFKRKSEICGPDRQLRKN